MGIMVCFISSTVTPLNPIPSMKAIYLHLQERHWSLDTPMRTCSVPPQAPWIVLHTRNGLRFGGVIELAL